MPVQLGAEVVEPLSQSLVKGPSASTRKLWEPQVPMGTDWDLHLDKGLAALSQRTSHVPCRHVLDLALAEMVGVEPAVLVTASFSVEIWSTADNPTVLRSPALLSRHIHVSWEIWVVSHVMEHFSDPQSSCRSPPARDGCTWGSNSH